MLRQANKQADLLEIRLDQFKPNDIKKLRRLCEKPVIFKMDRLDFEILECLPDYVDLPYKLSPRVFDDVKKKFPQIKRICSFHDVEKTGDLSAIYSQVSAVPAEIYKIATYATSTCDALRMLDLVKKKGCLGLCMGDYGAVTRILAPVFGAPWSYAPLSAAHQTATGQLTLNDLESIYHYRLHSHKTSVYALIGDPVCKSSSHLTHNFAFKKLGLDAVYVKLCVNKTNLEYCLALCRVLGFKGLSVTMPLKEEVTRHIDHCESKAVNTIGFRQEGVFGWNTDGRGALDALEKKGKVLGKKVVLLGAGGAAWGIAQETKKRGGHLVVLNRTLFRAQELAKSVGGLAFPLTEFAQVARSGYDILINCTSVGMDDDKSLPVPTEELLEKKVVMEIVVSPRVTPLVAAAKEKKCEIVEGIEMFIQQAVGQYRYWFQEHLLDD